MQLNQTEFLGHQNVNANTRSMVEVQKAQEQFWTSAYLAAIQDAKPAHVAVAIADTALGYFNNRFVPSLTPPPPNHWPNV